MHAMLRRFKALIGESKQTMDTVLLTKIISALLYPLGLFFLLLITAILCRSIGRRRSAGVLAGTAWLLLLLASNSIVATMMVKKLEQPFPQQAFDTIAQHDAILVLGGGLRLPQRPARHTQLSGGSDRYWHAANLYKAGKAKTVLLAGGNVFAQANFKGEAFYAAELLQQWGVPSRAIITETKSRNTSENVKNTLAWLHAEGIDSVLLVTSGYHMARALELFRDEPVKVTAAAADILIRDIQRPRLLEWLPSASALSLTTLAMHEYYGQAFIRLKRIFN